MNTPESIQQRLADALKEGDADLAEAAAVEALQANLDPLMIISQVMIPALSEIGDQFQCGSIYLPELMMAGAAAERVGKHLEEAIAARGATNEPRGIVVIGTVQGDVHDIGKNIVATMLRAHGFRVHDLGRNVAPSAFLDAAQEHHAQIVAMSSLMTTTRPNASSTLNLFKEVGARDKFRIIIGGGCVTEHWVNEIGADGFAPDAAAAVDLCEELVPEMRR
jgi:methylmalonyl-CoA mutase cobalamin-binding domain/chain